MTQERTRITRSKRFNSFLIVSQNPHNYVRFVSYSQINIFGRPNLVIADCTMINSFQTFNPSKGKYTNVYKRSLP